MPQSYNKLLDKKIYLNQEWLKLYKAVKNSAKCVQHFDKATDTWTYVKNPQFSYNIDQYRIIDRPAEYWLNLYEGGDAEYFLTKKEALQAAKALKYNSVKAAIHVKEINE